MSWLTGYQYRKPITISGSAGAGTGYQVLLKVGESEGSSDAHFHLEGHALNFPNDIRFTASDGVTELAHWLEKVEGTSPNRTAYFWVKVNESLDNDVDIYCYYGKEGDVSASNGEETFEFFEDFESGSLDGWQGDVDAFAVTADAAHDGNYGLKKNAVGKHSIYKFVKSYEPPIAVEAWNYNYVSYSWVGFGIQDAEGYIARKQGYFIVANGGGNDVRIIKDNGSLNILASESWSREIKWYFLRGIWLPDGTIKFELYDSDGVTLLKTITAQDTEFSNGLGGCIYNYQKYARFDTYKIRKYVEPEPAFSSAGAEEVAGGVAPISSAIADAYSIYVYSSNSAQDSYKLLNFASELLDEVYAILKFVDNSASDEYIILNFVSDLVSDKYKLMNFGGQNIKESYAILAFTSGRFSDIYDIYGFVSNDVSDKFKIFSFIFSSISDSYFISGLISAILTDTYKLLNFRSAGFSDSYTIFKILSKLAQDKYSIFNFSSGQILDTYKIFAYPAKSLKDHYKIWVFTTIRLADTYSLFKSLPKHIQDEYTIFNYNCGCISDIYKIFAYPVKSLKDNYKIWEFTAVRLTDTYSVLNTLSKLVQDEYSVFRFGKSQISDEYKILVLLTKPVEDIYRIREFTAVLLTEEYAILEQLIVRKIVTLNSTITREQNLSSSIDKTVLLKSKLIREVLLDSKIT